MANIFNDPFPQFLNSAGEPYVAGVLRFYVSESSTPLAVYSDRALSVSLGTSHELNSAGRTTSLIFLQDSAYKVTLENSVGTIIWTADPVYASDFSTYAQAYSYAGNPNGSVAGTAGSGTVPADMVFDRTNNILYICTSTGTSSTAVWTAINASAATQATPQPQGRLTLTSALPVLAADVTSATAVYYTPFVGNLVPIYNGTTTVPTTFSELTLTLASAHSLSTIYDVFVFSNAGVMTLATGPAWSSSAAGSGSRGTGAATTQLTRLNGYWVNTVQIAARNGATTYTIAANLATYVGSIFIDGTAGQVTCHTAYGQSRKWGVWNAYNRQPIELEAGDATASWTYNTNTIRASKGAAGNSLTTFCGLPEEMASITFAQSVQLTPTSTAFLGASSIGIGVNSTTAFTGTASTLNFSLNALASFVQGASRATLLASYRLVPQIGINTISALEITSVATNSGSTFFGTESDMLLKAIWRA